MVNNSNKNELFEFCAGFARDRVFRIQSQINEIKRALASETKSSAGDKHETARAMLQLEREKLGGQLREAEKMLRLMAGVSIDKRVSTASLGSLVLSTKNSYFLAISAGEFKKEVPPVFCISLQTPMGKLLLGKSTGDTIHFNNEKITILEVL